MKKVLAIVLSLVMVFAVLPVAVFSVSADDQLKYNSNIAVSYDPWSRDYANGTGISANAPRKVTYNDDGWMRIQSQDEDSIVNEGSIVSKQWQYKLDGNDQLSKQFENACFDQNNENFYFYAAIKSAKFINNQGQENANPVNLMAEISIVYEYDDGERGTLNWGSGFTLNKNYGFRYVATSKAIPDDILDATTLKIRSFGVAIQDYGFGGADSGLSELDVYVAPLYTQQVPATSTTVSDKIDNLDTFNEIAEDSFIYNNVTDVFEPDNFQWQYAYGEEPILPNEDKHSIYQRGQIKREIFVLEDGSVKKSYGYPIKADGNAFEYIPYTVHADAPETQVSNLKLTGTTADSATFSWSTAGGDAKYYYLVCTNTANAKDVKNVKITTKGNDDKVVTTGTISGLTAGATYNAFVQGYNIDNIKGIRSNTVTFTTLHDHVTELRNVKAVTCTEDGYTGDKVCTVCGETIEKGESIQAQGHKRILVNAKSPTCTEKGYTGDYYCIVCNQTVEQGEEITALGHKTELQNAKAVTCTEDGYTGDYVCTVCGETVEKGEEITALGHKTELQNAKAVTCTEDGYTGDYVCTVCGETVEKGEKITALGHKTELQNAKAVTCTENGYTGDMVCTVCGETIEKGKTIQAQGHKQVLVNAKSPTCTQTGYTGDCYCLVCNQTIEQGKKIATLGHKLVNKNAKVATYFEKGYTGDKVCSVCGEVIEKGKAIAQLKLSTPKMTVTAGKKLFKVKYNKVNGATGFQLRYKISGNWIVKNFNTKKSVTKTINKLKKGKKYTVQIRAFVKSGKKTAYSSWTKTKKVKVK